MMSDIIANWYFYIILVLVTWVVVLIVVVKLLIDDRERVGDREIRLFDIHMLTDAITTWLLCRVFGWHKWTWKIGDTGGKIYLDAPPPDCAKCERCGRRYGQDT